MPSVIMAGKHQGARGQGEEFPLYGVILCARITTREIGPSGTVDEKGIAGEDSVHGVQAHTVRRMAWCGQHPQGQRTDANQLAIANVHIHMRCWAP